MAYINFSTGFNITSADAIDKRLVMTKAEMLAVKKARMPDVYFVVCSEDKQFYIYDKTATPSTETGCYVLANEEILSRLSALEGDVEDLNAAIEDINSRLATEYLKTAQLPIELPGAIVQAMGSPETKQAIEQAVAQTIPGALSDAMSSAEGAQKIADAMFDSEQFDVNVNKKIEFKLDEAIQLIQAIDSN